MNKSVKLFQFSSELIDWRIKKFSIVYEQKILQHEVAERIKRRQRRQRRDTATSLRSLDRDRDSLSVPAGAPAVAAASFTRTGTRRRPSTATPTKSNLFYMQTIQLFVTKHAY
jgi:hypothetical protein